MEHYGTTLDLLPFPGYEDLSEVIRETNKNGDHSKILRVIQERKLSLVSHVKHGENDESIMLLRKLLVDVVNGHKIVKAILDNCVGETCEEEDSIDFAIKIDWSGMFTRHENHQTALLFDLLNFRDKHPASFSQLLRHPVIAAFIALKWRQSQKYFYAQSAMFLSFLMLYSVFIVSLFSRENICPSLDIKLPQPASIPCSSQDYKGLITTVLDSSQPTGILVCEIFLLALTIMLAFVELYQAFKLRRQYFREIENYFEWFVILSALISMAFKDVILQESSENPVSAFIRGITALGICFAWLELIFMIGRYPFSGGVFSIMFYNIIKILFRYVLAMFCMVVGHAFAFMVVNFGHNMKSFDSPFKSVVQTLTMALGEFNFEDIYNAFTDEVDQADNRTVTEDVISRNFAMILLILLILFGTVTMVNLFIASIMSDLQKLNSEVSTQSLVFTAHCSMLVEELLPDCLLEKMRLEDSKVYCVHDTCPDACRNQPLPGELSGLTEELKEIGRKQLRQ